MRCKRRFEIRCVRTNKLIVTGYGSKLDAMEELTYQTESAGARIVWG